jgi:hypothetical protein
VITSFLVGLKIPFQQIRKEKETQDGKHDKKFDQYDPPKPPAPGHFPETIHIEPEHFFYHL